MKEKLAEFLTPLADWLFSLILSVPLILVRIIFIGILAGLALWVFTLPAQQPRMDEKAKKSIFSDLRLFAFGVLALQTIFYLIF